MIAATRPSPAAPFASPHRHHRIALIPGDGTGPEVIAEAQKVLLAAAAAFDFTLDLTPYDLGGERYLRTGEVLPDSVVTELRAHDAILLGAVGHPRVPPGILERGILLQLRTLLDQYINLRPVRLYPGVETPLKGKGPVDLDYAIIRENTGGCYTGVGEIRAPGTDAETALQTSIYTRAQVERCLRYAFSYARTHGKKARGRGPANTLLLVGKSNVLTYTFSLWTRLFEEIGRDFPDITRAYAHVDATALYQIQAPESLDTLVTTNLFGDILTDLGAATQGGLGVAAGANLNPDGVSMFEPIGGTAPDWTGKNAINPVAAIAAAALLLENLHEFAAATAVDAAIRRVVLHRMKSQQAGQMGLTTRQVGDAIAQSVSRTP